MKEFIYVLTDENGIHARPAGAFVKLASTFKSQIIVKKGGKKADGKRLFALMGLSAKKGDKLTITIEGEDNQEATRAIQDFLIANM